MKKFTFAFTAVLVLSLNGKMNLQGQEISNLSKLVIYGELAYGHMKIDINGVEVVTLQKGEYTSIEIESGPYIIAVTSLMDLRNDCRLTIEPSSSNQIRILGAPQWPFRNSMRIEINPSGNEPVAKARFVSPSAAKFTKDMNKLDPTIAKTISEDESAKDAEARSRWIGFFGVAGSVGYEKLVLDGYTYLSNPERDFSTTGNHESLGADLSISFVCDFTPLYVNTNAAINLARLAGEVPGLSMRADTIVGLGFHITAGRIVWINGIGAHIGVVKAYDLNGVGISKTYFGYSPYTGKLLYEVIDTGELVYFPIGVGLEPPRVYRRPNSLRG